MRLTVFLLLASPVVAQSTPTPALDRRGTLAYGYTCGEGGAWQGDSEHWTAAIVDRLADVAAELLEYDPLGFLPPAHPSQSDRWARMEADIERAYHVRVTELLDVLGIDTAEMVP
jgi:hypothetical protein